MLHGLLHKNNLIGLFSDYEKCQLIMEGLCNNHFVEKKNLVIKSYYDNSITSCEYNENEVESFTDDDTTDDNNTKVDTEELDDDTQNKIKESRNNKIELMNNIHLLKKEKEKMNDSKPVYEVDLKLFNKFKTIKKENINFQIPDMFIDKYNLMLELENENKLTWENFYNMYKPTNLHTSYSDIFNN